MKAKKYFTSALILLLSACGSEDEIEPREQEDVKTFCITQDTWQNGPKTILVDCVELDGLYRYQGKKQFRIFESVNCECD